MSKTIRASVLILLLACSAYAGDMQNGVTDSPPPPPPSAVQEQPTGGEMQNGVADSLMETALTLLESVLALP
ncbi:MAG: hypothetical protein AUG51_14710 [Acidobacteria bacterium 13_1_20CM_3_53_8]|nr:MAG: hypothetical protein AUG51_14710 [Acidobacteria bacterium 13_1_20CM_3_53_8]